MVPGRVDLEQALHAGPSKRLPDDPVDAAAVAVDASYMDVPIMTDWHALDNTEDGDRGQGGTARSKDPRRKQR